MASILLVLTGLLKDLNLIGDFVVTSMRLVLSGDKRTGRVVRNVFVCCSQKLYDLLVFKLREIVIMCADCDKGLRYVEDIKVVDQHSYIFVGLSRS